MAQEITFDPARHLMKLKGRDYLEVKWRLVWLRSVHPDAQIETELVKANEGGVVFKATVTLPPDRIFPAHTATGELIETSWSGKATGYAMTTKEEFGDYLEKCETAAIGRALAALGFGTQFAGVELDEGAASGHVVDSPVDRGQPAPQPQRQMGDGVTEPQLKKLFAMGRNMYDMDAAAVKAWVVENNGKAIDELTKREASALIESWDNADQRG